MQPPQAELDEFHIDDSHPFGWKVICLVLLAPVAIWLLSLQVLELAFRWAEARWGPNFDPRG
jgi:hypothetical protein